ncbi:MAG: prolipoprotein diacylglyceryl transferase, partial [Burkholderiales bacterium]|nr:prolipoprotein diacylglyceryl transferase [Burkholderiales bacterium]
LFVLVWIYARKERPTLAVGALFVTLYGCARFFTEYFRTPDYEVDLIGITISAGQMLSLPMILVGTNLLAMAYTGKFASPVTHDHGTKKAGKKRK